MKRAAPGTSVAIQNSPREEILKLLHTSELSFEDLAFLGGSIKQIYIKKANSLVQNFPTDLWLAIFNELVSVYPKLKYWLRFRMVCKQWNSVIINRMDLGWAGFDRSLNPDHLLKIFNFTSFQLYDDYNVDYLLLSKVRSLWVYSSRSPVKTIHNLSNLTHLTFLSLSSTAVSTSTLQTLTGLKTLEVGSETITSVRALTNLERLNIFGSPSFKQSDLEHLTKLENISCSEPQFFRSGVFINPEIPFVYDGEWLKRSDRLLTFKNASPIGMPQVYHEFHSKHEVIFLACVTPWLI